MKKGTYVRTLEVRERQSKAMLGKGLGIKKPQMSIAFMGEKNPMWGKKRSLAARQKQSISRLKKSRGFSIKIDGYITRPAFSHPMKDSSGRVKEHRLVVEKFIGRYLKKSEVIHHIDGNKKNNLPKNLIAFSSHSAHLRFEKSGNIKPNEIIFDGRLI